jgi:hypothetical protein
MRLREIQRILRDNLPKLNFVYSGIGGSNYRIEQFREMLDGVRSIRETGMFQQETETILTTDVIARHAQSGFIVTGETVNRVNEALNQLKSRGSILLATLNVNLDPQPESGVSIRIPEATDLDSVADLLREVKTALEQLVVNSHVDGYVKLASFDRGSNWIELILGSIAAVKLLGMVLHLIVETRLKEAEIATRWESFKTMKIKNEALSSIQGALDLELTDFKNERLQAIADNIGVPNDEYEMRERVKFASSMLSDLISRGAEIVPSGEAPADVRMTFPSPTQLTGLLKEITGAKKEIEGDH